MRVPRGVAVAAAAVCLAGCGGTTSGAGSAPTSTSGAGSSSAPAPAGNGIAALSADQILARATTALQSASAVHIKAAGTSSGKPLTMDLHIEKSGDSAGTISIGGDTIEVLRIGQTGYLKADAAFWQKTAGPQVAAKMAGKYLKGSAGSQALSSVIGLIDLNSLAKEIVKPSGQLTKGGSTTIRGVPAVGLIDTGAHGGTLYIATAGQPYPLRVVNTTAAGGGGTVDFLDYGVPFQVAAPPTSMVVDVAKLGR